MDNFLGVEQSVTGRRWRGPDAARERLAGALSQRAGLSPALAQVLARQGVSPEAAPAYLEPKLRDLLPDPALLRDMAPAAERLMQAALAAHKVAIFADYDVDGGASAALLIDWFRHFGIEPTLYVPDRIDEGYGPNEAAMAGLAAQHDLIICVDCGTLSLGPISAARGADVVVLDHHLAGAELPDCLAVVNPNRSDDSSSQGHLCAAGVVFLVLVELSRRLKAGGLSGPDLMALLDLVALATVADVAPLIGVNRAFVRQGLKVMAGRARSGLAALADAAGLDRMPEAYHLGYVLGPRVNAGGRIGQADLGARLLSARDPRKAAEIAAELDRLNTERRAVEEAVRDAALAQAEARGLEAPLVWAAGEGWHPGVVGIVASRLKEASNRPAIVIGLGNGAGKGSGRSVSGVDLGATIPRQAAEGMIEKGGGHAMAAGLSRSADQLEPAMARRSELMAQQGAGAMGPRDLACDAVLAPGGATLELIDALETAGPFGQAAPAPRFAFADCRIVHAQIVGSGHLKLRFSDGAGKLDAIAFTAAEGPLGQAVLGHNGRLMHMAGRLEKNQWQGRVTPQLKLDDVAWAGQET